MKALGGGTFAVVNGSDQSAAIQVKVTGSADVNIQGPEVSDKFL